MSYDVEFWRRKYLEECILSAGAKAEIDTLRNLCGESYQVVGYLADSAALFSDPQTVRVLDNLSAAAAGTKLPHADLLPFDPKAPVGPRASFEAFVNTLPSAQQQTIREAAARGESTTARAFSAGYVAGEMSYEFIHGKAAAEPKGILL